MANNATTKTEIFFVGQSCDIHDLNVDHELSSIDISLVMSLLEDSQLKGDGDEETSRIMIQSLANQDSCSENYFSDFSDIDQLESCSSSSILSPDDHVNFEWNIDDDMEMDYSYHVELSRVELEGFQDYSQVCYGMELAMEKDYCNIDLCQ